MELSPFFRVGAIALAALLILVAALAVRRAPEPPVPALPLVTPALSPLRAELTRCQALGAAGAADDACLAAWAESRRRFLSGPHSNDE